MMDSRYKKGFSNGRALMFTPALMIIVLSSTPRGTMVISWAGVIRDVVGDPYQSINDPNDPGYPGYYGAFYPYQFNRKEADDTIYPALADITYSLGYACDYWKGNDRNQWPNNWDNDYPWVWQAWDDYYTNFGDTGSALTGIFPLYSTYRYGNTEVLYSLSGWQSTTIVPCLMIGAIKKPPMILLCTWLSEERRSMLLWPLQIHRVWHLKSGRVSCQIHGSIYTGRAIINL